MSASATQPDPPEQGNEDPGFLALLDRAARNVATAEPYALAWARVFLSPHAEHAILDGRRRDPDGEPVCSCGATVATGGRAA